MALREAGLRSRFTAFLLGRGSARRVWWLTLAMLGAGLGISHFLVDNGATPVVPITLSWWVFALIVAVIEFPLIHLYIRSEAHSFTLGELGLCLGLFLVPPEHFIIGAVVGATIAKFRLPPLKLAFNAALWVLQASVAVAVFQRIANLDDPFGGWGVVATFGSMSLVGIIGVVAVFAAITLVQGRLRGGPLAHAATIAAPVTVANTGLGLIAAYLLTQAPQLVFALFGPVAVLFLAYRAFIVEHQQHERLRVVYRATRSILEAPELSLAITSLLGQAREVFRADIAQIVLYPERDDEPILVSTAGPGDHLAAVRSVASLDGSVFAGVALTRRSERLDSKEMAYRGGMIGVDHGSSAGRSSPRSKASGASSARSPWRTASGRPPSTHPICCCSRRSPATPASRSATGGSSGPSTSSRSCRASSRSARPTTRSRDWQIARTSPRAFRTRSTRRQTAPSVSSTSTWTTSRRSTTGSATLPATGPCRSSGRGCARASARTTSPAASAATSSRCSSRG